MLVVEKKNNDIDGKYEMFGVSSPMKPTADGTARNEGENGGDITMTLQTTEPQFENTFSIPASTIQEIIARFDLMYAGAGEPWQEPE